MDNNKIKYLYDTFVDSTGVLHSIKTPVVYSNKEFFYVAIDKSSRLYEIKAKHINQEFNIHRRVWLTEKFDSTGSEVQINWLKKQIRDEEISIYGITSQIQTMKNSVEKKRDKIEKLRRELDALEK